MTIITTRYTHKDLRAMPDDGYRYEIIDREMFVSPTPTRSHRELRLLAPEGNRYSDVQPVGGSLRSIGLPHFTLDVAELFSNFLRES